MHRAARPTSSARTRKRAALALLGALVSGCVDRGPTGPNDAYVRVVIAATGGDVDQDGYDITIDALPRATLGDRAVDRTFVVPTGTHVIAIDKVAENCKVNGLNPRRVTVGRGETATVQFDVGCAATGVMITTRTNGGDIPQGFFVFVDALPAVLVGPNNSIPVTRLTSGKHTVSVQAPQHCTVSPSRTATVTVNVPGLTETSFDISCVAVQRLAKIAYVSGRWEPQKQRIELVNPDGSGVVQLQVGHSPAWSPDGKRLAFSTTQCVPSYYYDYPSACTGGLVMLDPELGDATEPIWGRNVENPSWSPTGDAIAVDRDGSISNDRDIAVAQLAAPLFAKLPIVSSGWKSQPEWSPDGSRIAFTCTVAQSTDICIVNRFGTGLVQLTNGASFDAHAAWSPDGTKIAFARYPDGVAGDGDAELAVMDVATRQLTILTPGSGEPAWSPDGSKLVFAGGDGLFIIDADGTNRRRLTTGPHSSPAWRP